MSESVGTEQTNEQANEHVNGQVAGQANGPSNQGSGPGVVRLIGANIPADQGLSSLGLLMQLGGSVAAAIITFWGFTALTQPTRAGSSMMILLLTTLGVVRSLMHRAAGTGLLYSAPGHGPCDPGESGADEQPAHPLRGVRRYILVALLHSALVSTVLVARDVAPTRMAVAIGLALASWPLILAGLLRTPWLRRFEHEVPAPEDKGFEGAAVLMTVMSIAGLAIAALLLQSFASRDALRGTNVLLLLCMLLLLARSALHLIAGITGLRNVQLDAAVERVAQYANLGLVSSFVTGGVLLITLMSEAAAGFSGLLVISVAVWMLSIWPMALRRFFAERQFASLLAGDAAPIHRRAPDAGLTALGWLLLAIGAVALSVSVAAAGGSFFDGSDDSATLSLLRLLMVGGSWRTFAVAALMLVAGFELVRMTRHHRAVATACAGAIAALELTTWGSGWSVISQLTSGLHGTSALAMLLGPLGLALTTIALVNRKIASAGHAQVRMAPRR
jgi:hypothetical protein